VESFGCLHCPSIVYIRVLFGSRIAGELSYQTRGILVNLQRNTFGMWFLFQISPFRWSGYPDFHRAPEDDHGCRSTLDAGFANHGVPGFAKPSPLGACCRLTVATGSGGLQFLRREQSWLCFFDFIDVSPLTPALAGCQSPHAAGAWLIVHFSYWDTVRTLPGEPLLAQATWFTGTFGLVYRY
jgi:hypothetical protein